MNKQELIERLERLIGYGSRDYIERNEVLDLAKQLDEPEKVKIPEFMADWIEKIKKELSLREAMSQGYAPHEVDSWLREMDQDGACLNQDVFARAWLDGYEVEKEKRYRISMPKTRNYMNHAQFLCEKDGKIFWCGEWHPFRTKFTRKQLEGAGFGWVFDCPGIEIEEVE